MKLKALKDILYNGRVVRPGEIVDLPEEPEARHYLAIDAAIEDLSDPEPPEAPPLAGEASETAAETEIVEEPGT